MSSSVLNTTEQVRQLVESLFESDDLIEIRMLPSGKSVWHKSSEVPAQEGDFRAQNQAGQNIYFGANPRNSAGGKAEHVLLARSLFADFDNTDLDSARRRIRESHLPLPTLLLNSGHGVHAYWRLSEPVVDFDHWKQLQQQLAQLLGSDSKVCDAPRIMRLPGFLNHKAPVARAELIEADSTRRFDLSSLEALLPKEEPKPMKQQADVNEPKKDRPVEHLQAELRPTVITTEVEGRAIAYMRACPPAIAGQGGHDQTFTVARSLVWGFDLSVLQAHSLLKEHYNPRCIPPWTDEELMHKCEEADVVPFEKPRGWLLNEQKVVTPFSDLWNARKLIERHGQDLRYVASWNKWIVWNGMRWLCDHDGEVMRRAKSVVDDMRQEAEMNQSKPLGKHAHTSSSSARLHAIPTLASTEPAFQ